MADVRDIDPQPLHISSDDISANLTWPLAIEAARTSAAASVSGDVEVRRATLPIKGGWMRLMAASVPPAGVFGYKEFHLVADGSVRYCIYLFDIDSGRAVGVVDAALVTTYRTAATAAIAAEHVLGKGAATRLAVVGSGAEALAGVAALNAVLKLESVTVTSRSVQNRENFVAAARQHVDASVSSAASVAETVQGADMVYVATNSGGHVVLDPRDVAGVPFIASIGSTIPAQREIAGGLLVAADRVIVDTVDVFHESGDMLEAVEQGFRVETAEQLGDAIESDQLPDPRRQTVYKSIGAPTQDLVLAAAIVKAGMAEGYGRRIHPLSAVKVNL